MTLNLRSPLGQKIVVGVLCAILGGAGSSLAHYITLGQTVAAHDADIVEIQQTIKSTLLTTADLRELVRRESPWMSERGEVLRKLEDINASMSRINLSMAVIADRLKLQEPRS